MCCYKVFKVLCNNIRYMLILYIRDAHAWIQKIFSGGPNSQKGSDMVKINNLAIPGGGGVRTPCLPSGSAHDAIKFRTVQTEATFHDKDGVR